jgi:biopolymer transport protein ExbD
MLVRDFSETDRTRAASLLLQASGYALKVPPPSMSARDLGTPKIEVQIDADGSVIARKEGSVLGRVSSAARLSEILPRCADDDPVSIAAGHAVEHATVIVVMDELRSLGCGHISFSVSR